MNSNVAAVRIRSMERADIDAVIAIAGKLEHAPRWPRNAYVQAVEPESMPPRVALVVESEQREVIGFAVCSVIPPQAELETIAIAHKAQRRGLGRRLLGQMVDEMRKRQITEVTLEVRSSNLAGLALYRSFGFVKTGVRRLYYADPQEDADLLTLAIERGGGLER